MTARIILSLSALAANLMAAAGPGVSPVSPSDSRPRLLGVVAAFVISAAPHAAPAPAADHYTPQAALALDALSDTPYHSSLWLLTSRLAVDSFERRHQRLTLRC